MLSRPRWSGQWWEMILKKILWRDDEKKSFFVGGRFSIDMGNLLGKCMGSKYKIASGLWKLYFRLGLPLYFFKYKTASLLWQLYLRLDRPLYFSIWQSWNDTNWIALYLSTTDAFCITYIREEIRKKKNVVFFWTFGLHK